MLVGCSLTVGANDDGGLQRVLHFPVVPHHVVEVDVLLDDGAVAHVVVGELALGDTLTAVGTAVHGVAVGTAVTKVIDERPQHLTARPVAVLELGMFHVVVRRLNTNLADRVCKIKQNKFCNKHFVLIISASLSAHYQYTT